MDETTGAFLGVLEILHVSRLVIYALPLPRPPFLIMIC
jgi:hypothetical protein